MTTIDLTTLTLTIQNVNQISAKIASILRILDVERSALCKSQDDMKHYPVYSVLNPSFESALSVLDERRDNFISINNELNDKIETYHKKLKEFEDLGLESKALIKNAENIIMDYNILLDANISELKTDLETESETDLEVPKTEFNTSASDLELPLNDELGLSHTSARLTRIFSSETNPVTPYVRPESDDSDIDDSFNGLDDRLSKKF